MQFSKPCVGDPESVQVKMFQLDYTANRPHAAVVDFCQRIYRE